MTPPIAIVGGGPCGLTLARLLECKGIDYLVYERDENEISSSSGGALDLHPETGQKALREAGLFEEFKKYARYEDTVLTIADKHGTQHLRVGEGRDAPEIDRFELRKILLASIPKDKIKWSHVLVSARPGEDGKTILQFANGDMASGFKLVVGTDGAWSKVRPLITAEKPSYVGQSYIESRIKPGNPFYETATNSIGRGSTTAIGSRHIVLTQKQGDSSYRIYFGFDMPENAFRDRTIDLQDAEAMRRLLLSREHYADWGQQYQDLIRHATDFRGWPIYSLSPESLRWESVSGVTIAGDAAHVTIPGGEGVNLAMTDSFELADKIAEHGIENMDQAVREYEASMLVHGIGSINRGKVMAGVMFSEDQQAFLQLLKSFVSIDAGAGQPNS